jgi:chaperonin GroES
MAYAPLWDYVLVDVEAVKSQTESGLWIPSSTKEVPPVGTILAVGPDCKTVKVGDKVLFARMAARYVDEDATDENTGQRLVHERDCWATFTDA